MTDPIEVLDVHREHYQTIMQHDPDNHAMDEEHWQSKIMYCERAEDLQGINKDLTWLEALESIRRMKRNTEHTQTARERRMYGRNPAKKPRVHKTRIHTGRPPSGKATKRPNNTYGKIPAVWTQEKIPAQWQEAHLWCGSPCHHYFVTTDPRRKFGLKQSTYTESVLTDRLLFIHRRDLSDRILSN